VALASNEAALTIVLQARDDTKGAIDTAEQKITKLEKAHALAKSAVGALSGVLASSLVGSLSDAARAAADDEANVAKLQQAVENTGASWEVYDKLFAERIKQGQDLAFTDTEIRDSLAGLTSQTGEASSALQLNLLAMDLARAKGIDLATASDIVGKAAAGNTTQLGKLYPALKDAANATEALGMLQKLTAGQAEIYGKSTAGSIFKVKDAADEMKETVGATLGPMQGLIGLLPGLTSGMTLAGGAVGAVSPKVAELTGKIVGNVGGWQSLGSTLVKGGIVLGALALAVEALDQVRQTVDLVKEHWDVFVYALTTGKLNDIPVFGFFFGKAQAVLGFLQNIKKLWDAVSGAFGGGGGASNTSSSNPNGYPAGYEDYIPQYAAGTPYVPRTGLALLHEGERVTPASGNGGGGGSLTLTIPVVIDGREVARATRTVDVDEARRRGIVADPVGA
jgi:hypothetical protein